MKNKTAFSLAFCALFAAFTAVLSQLSIPIQPVPINLATLSVYLAGAVLGAKYAAVSQAVYVLLGAAGLPVFAQFSGGIHVILGPTGGYIIGYIAAAWLIGYLCDRFGRKLPQLAAFMTAGILFCYLLGTAWFMFVTKTGLVASLTMCVLPFIPGDAAKIAFAAVLAPRLNVVLQKQFPVRVR
jgi:biotin transport system substrate-specific component